jgi:hypothetical protein
MIPGFVPGYDRAVLSGTKPLFDTITWVTVNELLLAEGNSRDCETSHRAD